MRTLALILFSALGAIALLHAYWGVGGLWPGQNEQELIDTVIGAPGWTRMPPPWMTFIVSALIFAAGGFALVAGGVLGRYPRWLVRIPLAVLTIVFLGRAVSGFTGPARGVALSEPFATYDVALYSPLCLLVGLGFAALTWRPRSP